MVILQTRMSRLPQIRSFESVLRCLKRGRPYRLRPKPFPYALPAELGLAWQSGLFAHRLRMALNVTDTGALIPGRGASA